MFDFSVFPMDFRRGTIAAVGAIEGLVAGMRILLGLVDGALENDGSGIGNSCASCAATGTRRPS